MGGGNGDPVAMRAALDELLKKGKSEEEPPAGGRDRSRSPHLPCSAWRRLQEGTFAKP